MWETLVRTTRDHMEWTHITVLRMANQLSAANLRAHRVPFRACGFLVQPEEMLSRIRYILPPRPMSVSAPTTSATLRLLPPSPPHFTSPDLLKNTPKLTEKLYPSDRQKSLKRNLRGLLPRESSLNWSSATANLAISREAKEHPRKRKPMKRRSSWMCPQTAGNRIVDSKPESEE